MTPRQLGLATLGASAALLAGCGGSSAPTSLIPPAVAQIAAPSPSAPPGSSTSAAPSSSPTPALLVTPSQLEFTAAGQSKTIAPSEPGYAGPFSETDTCAGIATVTPSGPTSFDVVAVGPGSCTVTVHDGNGRTADVSIGVTTVGFSVQ